MTRKARRVIKALKWYKSHVEKSCYWCGVSVGEQIAKIEAGLDVSKVDISTNLDDYIVDSYYNMIREEE